MSKDINTKYEGSSDENGIPNGEGILKTFHNNKISKIEKGLFSNGYLIEGSETTYLENFIKKEIGKWRYDQEKNFCDEFISGDGQELYFKSEEDLKQNNFFGFVKGIFDDGTLIKGEVYNAFEIDYSDHKFVKRILVENKNTGKIFFENGDYYEGELFHDMPQGNGIMNFKNGEKKSGKWVNGNLE